MDDHAKDKEVSESESDESDGIDEAKFGSLRMNQNALAEAAMLDYYAKQAAKGKSDH